VHVDFCFVLLETMRCPSRHACPRCRCESVHAVVLRGVFPVMLNGITVCACGCVRKRLYRPLHSAYIASASALLCELLTKTFLNLIESGLAPWLRTGLAVDFAVRFFVHPGLAELTRSMNIAWFGTTQFDSMHDLRTLDCYFVRMQEPSVIAVPVPVPTAPATHTCTHTHI